MTFPSLTFKIRIVCEYAKYHNVKRAYFSKWPDAEAASADVESGRGDTAGKAGAETRQAQRRELYSDFNLPANRVAKQGSG